MPSEITTESILEWFRDAVENHRPVETRTWLDAAQKLCVLMGNLNEDAIGAEMAYRRLRGSFLEKGETSAASEAKAKCSPEYEKFLKLRAEVERVSEFIKIAKKRTEIKDFQL